MNKKAFGPLLPLGLIVVGVLAIVAVVAVTYTAVELTEEPEEKTATCSNDILYCVPTKAFLDELEYRPHLNTTYAWFFCTQSSCYADPTRTRCTDRTFRDFTAFMKNRNITSDALEQDYSGSICTCGYGDTIRDTYTDYEIPSGWY